MIGEWIKASVCKPAESGFYLCRKRYEHAAPLYQVLPYSARYGKFNAEDDDDEFSATKHAIEVEEWCEVPYAFYEHAISKHNHELAFSMNMLLEVLMKMGVLER